MSAAYFNAQRTNSAAIARSGLCRLKLELSVDFLFKALKSVHFVLDTKLLGFCYALVVESVLLGQCEIVVPSGVKVLNGPGFRHCLS